jgi:hypothetical protein
MFPSPWLCFFAGDGFSRREGFSGAHERIRTADLILTKDVLYQLSYMGEIIRFFSKFEGERETRFELAAFSLEG